MVVYSDWVWGKDLPWQYVHGWDAWNKWQQKARKKGYPILNIRQVVTVEGHVVMVCKAQKKSDEKKLVDVVWVWDAKVTAPSVLPTVKELIGMMDAAKNRKQGFSCITSPLTMTYHETDVVNVSFVRDQAFESKLLMLIAQVDGVAHLLEWHHSKLKWMYRNQFCFLRNQNLQWMKPVRKFDVIAAPYTDCFELMWLSCMDKTPDEICFRYVHLSSYLTTQEIQVGDSFAMSISDVCNFFPMRCGVWILCEKHLFFRNILTKQVLRLDYSGLNPEGNVDVLFARLHQVTGEIILLTCTGKLFVCCVNNSAQIVETHLLCTIANWEDSWSGRVMDFDVHGDFAVLIVLDSVIIFNLSSGAYITRLELPSMDYSAKETWHFWKTNTLIGVWASNLFLKICAPPGKSQAYALSTTSRDKFIGFRQLQHFGKNLQFETMRQAMSCVKEMIDQGHSFDKYQDVIDFVLQHTSNPTLLLSGLYSNKKLPPQVLRRLEIIVNEFWRLQNPQSSSKDSSMIDEMRISSITELNMDLLETLVELYEILALSQAISLNGDGQPHKAAPASSADSKDDSLLRWDREVFSHNCLHILFTSCSQAQSSRLFRDLKGLLLGDYQFDESLDLPSLNLASSCPVWSPSHLLFHEERTLLDLETSRSTTYVKHLYYEILCRLYLSKQPLQLGEFVRNISLYGTGEVDTLALFRKHIEAVATRRSRTHVERALLIMPSRRELVGDSRYAYAQLLLLGGFYTEAVQFLLKEVSSQQRAKSFKYCLRQFRLYRANRKKKGNSVIEAHWYLEMLKHCTTYNTTKDIQTLVQQKPDSVTVSQLIYVLHAGLRKRSQEIEEIYVRDLKDLLLTFLLT